MKARDIVPGWPKGRSTTVSYYNDIECRLAWLEFGFGFRVNWAVRMKLIDELKKELSYHQQQQQMTDNFRKKREKYDLTLFVTKDYKILFFPFSLHRPTKTDNQNERV